MEQTDIEPAAPATPETADAAAEGAEQPKTQGGDVLLDFRGLITAHNVAGILDIVMLFLWGNRWFALATDESSLTYTPFRLLKERPDTTDMINSHLPAAASGMADIFIYISFAIWCIGFITLFADLAYRLVFKHDEGRALPNINIVLGFVLWLMWNIIGFCATDGISISVGPLAGLYIIFGLIERAFCGEWGKRAVKTLFTDFADETRDTGIGF